MSLLQYTPTVTKTLVSRSGGERPIVSASCVAVTPECPVEATLYGYYPSIGANGFFAGFFAVCMIIHLIQGIRYKTWTYMIALGLGCLGEAIGYAGRIMLWNNPYDDLGFQIQICCLIISPAFISGGIYLTLKHIVINFGEKWSRLRPAWYTYIFITGDIFSLVLQGAGGGIAATADRGTSMQDVGTNLMIAGVIFQVVILSIFGYFLGEYTLRTYRRRDQLSVQSMTLFNSKKFRCFVGAIITAYSAIQIRCIYRIPELTGGWGNELMRNEPEFIVLEGVMIVIAVLALTVFHPGYCFPALGATFTNDVEMMPRAYDPHPVQ
ncbi:sphingoid long-chain base transporter RSB1 [Lojkania enalia]|uniref:Sphingoid long-chain base transporter RSB1 n=1 Tax=Lojkania enalia TaxID=147567 RepID=A0A9P4NAM0_9PLEO|nr:sphingoid long-chain base transporter RSB1 [Didymosphaeria enalia]